MSENQSPTPAITPDMIANALQLIGLDFSAGEIELMVKGINERVLHYAQLRGVPLANSVSPALTLNVTQFAAQLGQGSEIDRSIEISAMAAVERPTDLEDVAFYPVTHLAQLLQTRQVSSQELTAMYLERLKRYDPLLQCVVTLRKASAMAQARRADEEIANGHYRGPLHGIPWGVKDLLATRGEPTTWGAPPYRDQVFAEDATVVQRLAAAGAVLAAKLTTGSLAQGDVWFGGQTRNPWEVSEGASGSSAGSASATAAGLVGFSIGTETMGSITSPCMRCGVTGLRPTFGRVSRHGAMALSWSMDKIGPITRSVEDCALVFNTIHGADGQDATAINAPFHWNPQVDWRKLRIGYVKDVFESQSAARPHDQQTLDVLRSLGATLTPIELPDYPHEALMIILAAEAAAAFDELTRSNRDDLLVRQGEDAWPNNFRKARLIPAVDYIQANRVRMQLMEAMAQVMTRVDLYLQPHVWGKQLAITNYTGHPAVVLPNGFGASGKPESSMVFIGQLYGEAKLLAVAKAYQDATEFHRQHPPLTIN